MHCAWGSVLPRPTGCHRGSLRPPRGPHRPVGRLRPPSAPTHGEPPCRDRPEQRFHSAQLTVSAARSSAHVPDSGSALRPR